MVSASATRLLKTNGSHTLAPVNELRIADLPQAGSSPAIDLQRRLGEAALRGFYATEPTRQKGMLKRFVIAGGMAIVSWMLTFYAGSLIIS